MMSPYPKSNKETTSNLTLSTIWRKLSSPTPKFSPPPQKPLMRAWKYRNSCVTWVRKKSHLNVQHTIYPKTSGMSNKQWRCTGRIWNGNEITEYQPNHSNIMHIQKKNFIKRKRNDNSSAYIITIFHLPLSP